MMTEPPPPNAAAGPAPARRPAPVFVPKRDRRRFLGLSFDDAIKHFFGGNAFVAVVVLVLITIFLFREGYGFFTQNAANLRIYRQAGLEFVDIVRAQESDHTALVRYLSDLRQRQVGRLIQEEHLAPAAVQQALAPFDDFAGRFADAAEPVRGLVSELTDVATAVKTKFLVGQDKEEERAQLLAAGRTEEAARVQIETVDLERELAPLLAARPLHREADRQFAAAMEAVLATPPTLPTEELQARMTRFGELVHTYIAGFPDIEQRLEAWDFRKPVPRWQRLTSFLFGREWLTASFWQDWYGVIPLFVGSLMVSFVALVVAVPLGVGSAIYVNQIASPAEQRLIKPCIEFISAIPSVVLGFFGIVVLGELLRRLSQSAWLEWVPGFPIIERLNVMTAGCLLALIAIPTIFTLAEDALNNVPGAYREASLALGATPLQTTLRIMLPAALSGIVSAVLLGLGRVIGETMVVLLCAGNRIAIPDFTAGLGAFVQPVHTMTGIIAQEMGEVVRGSIHYRALFVVGITLFFLSLLINYLAQKIVRGYRLAIG